MSQKLLDCKNSEACRISLTIKEDGNGNLTTENPDSWIDLGHNYKIPMYGTSSNFILSSNENGIQTAEEIISALQHWIKLTKNKVFK